MDRLIGPVLLKIFPVARSQVSLPKTVQRILVIRPGGMGDALLLLPSLKQAHKNGRVKIDILCEPRNMAVFQCCPFVHRIFSYQDPFSFLSVFKLNYDAVIDTEQSYFLSALTARLVKAHIRLGFDTFNRGLMFTHPFKYQNSYEAEVFWCLFSTLFGFKKPFSLNQPYLQASDGKANLYSKLNQIICLFPGATTPERHWPSERWASVCNWLLKRGNTPILIGGKMERPSCLEIYNKCKTPGTINLCGQLSIPQTIHLFSRAKKLISTDSGILHLAVVCNLPTVSLFGPSDPAKWGPKGLEDHIIHKNSDCSPCASFGTIPDCPNECICMQKITPEDVISALNSL